MRSEKEMLELIIRTAREDERIRAAYLEGSRVNPEVPRDLFQDYDVKYIVNETESFQKDRAWIDRFGKRLYMQFPEDGPYYESDREHCYGWLMQLADGNRLDLHVVTLDYALKSLELYMVLVDKDGCMPADHNTSDEIYWVKRPDQEHFSATCNEFWWCLNNVAKGIWRDELPYALNMIGECVRPMLERMIGWKIGKDYQFRVSPGKQLKYMKKYVPESVYERYLRTYSGGAASEIWDSVMVMCGLFQELAIEVSSALGLIYNNEEGENSLSYLRHVRYLPKDAEEIYDSR